MSFQINLKEIRLKHGLSQYKLALLTGLSRNKITMVECGYTQLSFKENEKVLKKLAEFAQGRKKLQVRYE